MAGQITGREFYRQAVYNGIVPDDGQPYAVRVFYDFSTLLVQKTDFTVGEMNQNLPFIQSAVIDNGKNPNPLVIFFPIINWTLKVPARSQGVFPVLSPTPFAPVLTVSAAIAAPNGVEILWCNFMQPLASWASF